MRENSSLSGYCSQNSNIIHFGLKDHSKIDTLKIIWPSGIQQIFSELPANEEITVEETASATNEGLHPKPNLLISPNPSSSTINLSVDFPNVPEVVLMTISDVSGKVVYSENILRPHKNWSKILNISDLSLSPALYHLHLSTSEWLISESVSILP